MWNIWQCCPLKKKEMSHRRMELPDTISSFKRSPLVKLLVRLDLRDPEITPVICYRPWLLWDVPWCTGHFPHLAHLWLNVFVFSDIPFSLLSHSIRFRPMAALPDSGSSGGLFLLKGNSSSPMSPVTTSVLRTWISAIQLGCFISNSLLWPTFINYYNELDNKWIGLNSITFDWTCIEPVCFRSKVALSWSGITQKQTQMSCLCSELNPENTQKVIWFLIEVCKCSEKNIIYR